MISDLAEQVVQALLADKSEDARQALLRIDYTQLVTQREEARDAGKRPSASNDHLTHPLNPSVNLSPLLLNGLGVALDRDPRPSAEGRPSPENDRRAQISVRIHSTRRMIMTKGRKSRKGWPTWCKRSRPRAYPIRSKPNWSEASNARQRWSIPSWNSSRDNLRPSPRPPHR